MPTTSPPNSVNIPVITLNYERSKSVLQLTKYQHNTFESDFCDDCIEDDKIIIGGTTSTSLHWKKLLENLKSFYKKIEKLSDSFDQEERNIVKKKGEDSISKILLLDPQYYSFELTRDGSLFHTLTLNNTEFHLEHFLINYDENDEDDPESLLSFFYENGNSFTSGGTFYSSLKKLEHEKLSKYTGSTVLEYGLPYKDFAQEIF